MFRNLVFAGLVLASPSPGTAGEGDRKAGYVLDLDGWRHFRVPGLRTDGGGNLQGVDESLFNVLGVNAKDQEKLLAVLTRARDEIRQHQRKVVNQIETVALGHRGKVFQVSAAPALETRWRKILWEESVSVLGPARAAFFVDKVQQDAEEVGDLQGFGGATMTAEIDHDAGRRTGNLGHVIFSRDGVETGRLFNIYDPPYFDPTVARPEAVVLKTFMGPKESLSQQECKEVVILPDGRLFVPPRFGSYLLLDLVDIPAGTVNPHTMTAIGLDLAEQVRLQNIIDGQRQLFSGLIVKSLRKSHDEYGNLLVEIPDLRITGRVFRAHLFATIHQQFGRAISVHFMGLLSPMLGYGLHESLYEDWFSFGEPVTYIVRGGAKDDRRDEVPPGELWIQMAQRGSTIEEGYDYSIEVCKYEQLPRYLRQVLPRNLVEPFVGKEKP